MPRRDAEEFPVNAARFGDPVIRPCAALGRMGDRGAWGVWTDSFGVHVKARSVGIVAVI